MLGGVMCMYTYYVSFLLHRIGWKGMSLVTEMFARLIALNGSELIEITTGMNRGLIKVSRLYKCIYNILIYMV